MYKCLHLFINHFFMNTISDNLTAHTPIKEKKVFNIIYIYKLQVPALLEDTKK